MNLSQRHSKSEGGRDVSFNRERVLEESTGLPRSLLPRGCSFMSFFERQQILSNFEWVRKDTSNLSVFGRNVCFSKRKDKSPVSLFKRSQNPSLKKDELFLELFCDETKDIFEMHPGVFLNAPAEIFQEKGFLKLRQFESDY